MKEGKGNTILLTIVGIATLLVAVVGATFAYFTAVLSGQETESSFRVISGSIGTVFDGGTAVTAENIWPRDESWGTKTFSIKHTSETVAGVEVSYALGLVIDEYTFEENALKFTLVKDEASTANGTFAPNITELTNIPNTGTQDLGTGSFISPTVGEAIHTYHLDIFFPDTNMPQDESQGKIFRAHISITQPNPET